MIYHPAGCFPYTQNGVQIGWGAACALWQNSGIEWTKIRTDEFAVDAVTDTFWKA
jgi:hypothetical protein